MPKIEPEIIKQWREEFKLRTDKIEADADQEVNEMLRDNHSNIVDLSGTLFTSSLSKLILNSRYEEGTREVSNISFLEITCWLNLISHNFLISGKRMATSCQRSIR